MLNTVAFIESIEPDFEYQGLEGAMSLVVENAENFALINDVIDEGAEIAEEEVYTEGVIGATAKYVRKAIEWIIKNIKKAIAKLKSLFLSLVHKLKMAYLSAMRSIGKFAAKNLVSKNGGAVKVKWFRLKSGEFGKLCEDVAGQIKDIAADCEGRIQNGAAFINAYDMDNQEADREAIDKSIERDKQFSKAKFIKARLKEITHNKKEAGALFEAQETATASASVLKDMYEKSLVKGVNQVYKTMMKANDHLLKAAAKAEKAVNKDKSLAGEENFGKKDKSHISRPKLIIKGLNAAVHTVISLNSALFSVVYRTSVFALHQTIKATVYAIKRTVMGDDAYKTSKESRKAVKAELKDSYKARTEQESAELDIEDILA